MSKRVRAGALLAILAVLLGGVVVVLWRGEPIPAELLAPLGVITAFLVWAEKEGGGKEIGHQRPPPGESAEETAPKDGETG